MSERGGGGGGGGASYKHEMGFWSSPTVWVVSFASVKTIGPAALPPDKERKEQRLPTAVSAAPPGLGKADLPRSSRQNTPRKGAGGDGCLKSHVAIPEGRLVQNDSGSVSFRGRAGRGQGTAPTPNQSNVVNQIGR